MYKFIDKLPCYGGIIFDETKQYVLLVVKNDTGHYGFPKGKRNKNETSIQTALREIYEETSLTQEDLSFINMDKDITEKSINNNPNIGYFVATSNKNKKICVIDQDEGLTVCWKNIEELNNILPERKIIVLSEALRIIYNDQKI